MPLYPHLRLLQIWGSNTNVGKTLLSSILARSFRHHLKRTRYLKPISTGPDSESDTIHLSHSCETKCLFQLPDAVSPHLALQRVGSTSPDILSALRNEIQRYAAQGEGVVIIETAGGVLSPSVDGTPQGDFYRPLRLPALLVGDYRLGGIGTTISAYESLVLRGYEVQGVGMVEEGGYANYEFLKRYLADRGVGCFAIEPPPEGDGRRDGTDLLGYYDRMARREGVRGFVDGFLSAHEERVKQLKSLPKRAERTIWHPFMQHSERSENTIVAIDAAYGDYFQTFVTGEGEGDLLRLKFDGSASWWTQGLGHGNVKLALTAAHAAGRYGHVMFAGAAHEAAVSLAERLLARMGNKRLKKVFFTDNGSTGMEVAVKMALRYSTVHKGMDKSVAILGLKNSYHGDTLGTMACSEPSIYNEKVEWYTPRGVWVDFPKVKLVRGVWMVEDPEGEKETFNSLQEIFDFDARPKAREAYESCCTSLFLSLETQNVGALILEPIILGAGGMHFADPLFQHVLASFARSADVPIIYDEVFTGLYRLGRFSSGSWLGVDADVVVNAKLLTGGLLPLCTTSASDAIFEAFLSSEKSDALLHGHSYTAHPVGCEVAIKSLDELQRVSSSTQGRTNETSTGNLPPTSDEVVSSMWSTQFITTLSMADRVEYTFSLGSVCVICLHGSGGYASTAAAGLRDYLFTQGIHSRVLGNVLYLMAAPTTTPTVINQIEDTVAKAFATGWN
ncbi:putative bifunctional diaminopelargonate synthase [Piedraia hortae CBS 480.64]|uniref:Putative bifunctional diaminopelargonate synthase n=1 Tax=Piedraia hortae CBS 480.64 TaxID=1314780 RepID=A0A6A7C641_9PEZI|nr:putative bifunctional diaminopelargonate synthase [Piedraia hortae CBS 480.64]